jgi:group II intron reverse transcriptase/maturase
VGKAGKAVAKLVRSMQTRRSDANLAARIWEPDNLTRAWRRVKANGGGPGVDGESLRAFESNLGANLEALRQALQSGEYRPQPVRRVWAPKPGGGERPLAILTIRDRIAQRAAYDVLAPLYEQKFLDCNYGFREGRSTRDAAKAILAWRDRGRRWVVDGDIRDCFENLDHRLLLKSIARDVKDRRFLQLIERWLKAQVFNDLSGRDLTAGAFQGGVISPLLANIYLHTFDETLMKAELALVRYADDWLILCAKKAEAQSALETATSALERLRLAVNPYKTRIVHFNDGFRFVGMFFVRGEFYNLSSTPTPALPLTGGGRKR